MAHIEPLTTKQWPPEMRDALAAMVPPQPRHPRLHREGRPKGANILGTLAHHPALARAFLTFNGHLLLATTLTERQRELLVMRVAAVSKSSYEWAQHLFLARDVGLSDDEIAWIGWGADGPLWDALDAALLRAVDELVGDGAIAPPTLEVLRENLDTQQILDVIYTVGCYQNLAWMLRSFDIDLDDDIRELLAARGGSTRTDS
ncbi:carboxymuconolactone decarboxylase family protein [Mycolicibacterium komossense]|uniref:Carboxymuconolactone decarboxylase family protein n=1 Tax=Mycolicibacterium komossense TaxID=1779 RepID=A0ABT3CIE4_9MYCO|nr:carboxymuconolactone decarboxylase family protein [Mycolicibacterium komossense]MCV7229219.1 carboxymuconolactone decarboxylase family protein [Mycolicibacterium komossense]